jgi:hypothetical protein
MKMLISMSGVLPFPFLISALISQGEAQDAAFLKHPQLFAQKAFHVAGSALERLGEMESFKPAEGLVAKDGSARSAGLRAANDSGGPLREEPHLEDIDRERQAFLAEAKRLQATRRKRKLKQKARSEGSSESSSNSSTSSADSDTEDGAGHSTKRRKETKDKKKKSERSKKKKKRGKKDKKKRKRE